MNIQSLVENDLEKTADSVWRMKGHDAFDYSDGAYAEKHLERAFREAKDLSTNSTELEARIRDWPSEYHLSTKRSQLLSGFTFDRSLKVLEVGCGCGAITRYLGENFDHVISVEGAMNRARLARQRTRDLETVSILCAPFQQLRFRQKFDIIFCVGVFEYSASFIEAEDPYDAALSCFSSMLNPNGTLVIAIENQFGLKYFNGIHEDHVGTRFEGLEGYRRRAEKVRTFGKGELRNRLKKHFQQVRFYYPYPDYKIPDCVISEEFLASGKAGELVSQIRSRDYIAPTRELWDASLTTLELDKNQALDFFANSFLVFASRSTFSGFSFDQLAILFSSGRKPAFSTHTRILLTENGHIVAAKRKRRQSRLSQEIGGLQLLDADTTWHDTPSLQTQVVLHAEGFQRPLADIFKPCKPWVDLLFAESRFQEDGVHYLDGAHIDSIWSNAFITEGTCHLADREWVWPGTIRTHVVIIRSIYFFLHKLEPRHSLSRLFKRRSGQSMIRAIAVAMGVRLSPQDFAEFVRLEADFQSSALNINKKQHAFFTRWFLFDQPTLQFFRLIKQRGHTLLSVLRAVTGNLCSHFSQRIHNR